MLAGERIKENSRTAHLARNPACACSLALNVEGKPMRIADVVRRKGRGIDSIPATHSLETAARRLWQHQVGALVVTDAQGELAGILTERDVVRAIADFGPEALQREVGTIMNPDVVTCTPEDRVERVTKLMTQHGIRHMPVREGGRLVAMVSVGDLARLGVLEKNYEIGLRRRLNILRFA
jgi:CBS domain-containing protein